MSSVIRLIHASIATKPLRRAARKTTLWFTWPVVLLATASLLAQQQTKDLGEASLEELANITVYTASRHIQKATEASSSVTVITRDEIQKYGYRTLADILRSVRGFDITYDRNFTYAGVRGINRPETYNSRVLLLIDGHRINNNIYEQAMLGTEFPLDVALIERVEVVRGPSSSLYGTSALFAVIIPPALSPRYSMIRGRVHSTASDTRISVIGVLCATVGIWRRAHPRPGTFMTASTSMGLRLPENPIC